jgi:hypothetical protein
VFNEVLLEAALFVAALSVNTTIEQSPFKIGKYNHTQKTQNHNQYLKNLLLFFKYPNQNQIVIASYNNHNKIHSDPEFKIIN